MRKLIIPLLISSIMIAAVFAFLQIARGQAPVTPNGEQVLFTEKDGTNVREITSPSDANVPQAPDISFIDSPSATCYQPDPGQNTCYLNWYYMSVTADPNYMIAMTVTLNTIGVVARTAGFFQTSMYIPHAMFDKGFEVPCGALGAGGDPKLGASYPYTIQARDSSNLKSANYGTMYCPAFLP